MKCIILHAAASGPEFNLDAGKPYLVPDAVAKKLLTAQLVGPNGGLGGKAAGELVTDPKLVAKATRLPAQPDPDDKGDMAEESFLEE